MNNARFLANHAFLNHEYNLEFLLKRLEVTLSGQKLWRL